MPGIFSLFRSRKNKQTVQNEEPTPFRLPDEVLANARAMYAALKKELSEPVIADRYTEILTEDSPLLDITTKERAAECTILIAERALSGMRPDSILPEVEALLPDAGKDDLLPRVRACCSMANSALTQVRCEGMGRPLYVWRCVKDERSNPAHVAMDGVVCSWMDKPCPDAGTGKRFHPGQVPGCRCSTRVVLALEDIHFPARCSVGGKIVEAVSADEVKKLFSL